MNNLPHFELKSVRFSLNRYLDDAMELTVEEAGVYVLLLAYQWRKGAVPADAERRKRICSGVEPTRAVMALFDACNEGLRSPWLHNERRHFLDVQSKRRRAGQLSRTPKQQVTSTSQASATLCKCGCGRKVAAGKHFTTRGCANRWQGDERRRLGVKRPLAHPLTSGKGRQVED